MIIFAVQLYGLMYLNALFTSVMSMEEREYLPLMSGLEFGCLITIENKNWPSDILENS